MSPQQFIEPHAIAIELTYEWSLPYTIAAQIIRGVLQSGACFVRGRGPGEIGLRDISKDIATALSREAVIRLSGLVPWGFTDVEIDRECLIKHGRRLVPPAYVSNSEARHADVRWTTPTVVAETRMRNWLREQDDYPPGRKKDIFDWAKAGRLIGEQGKALSKKGFDRAWRDEAPTSWKRRGVRTRFLELSDV